MLTLLHTESECNRVETKVLTYVAAVVSYYHTMYSFHGHIIHQSNYEVNTRLGSQPRRGQKIGKRQYLFALLIFIRRQPVGEP